jgi:hypothetical protein
MVQADRTQPWIEGWGNLVEYVHANKKLPPEQWQRYIRQAACLSIHVRPTVRRGDLVPVYLRAQCRGGFGLRGMVLVEYDCASISVSGQPLSLPRSSPIRRGSFVIHPGQMNLGAFLLLDADVLSKLTDGPQQLGVVLDVRLHDTPATPPVVLEGRTLECAWALATQPTVSLVDRPELRAAVEQSLRADPIGAGVRPSDGTATPGLLHVSVNANHPPMDLAFDMFLRFEGREVPMGSVEFRSAQSSGSEISTDLDVLRGAHPDHVDVILRPSIRAAANTLDITSIWNVEVVLKDVPAHGPQTGPSTAPARVP